MTIDRTEYLKRCERRWGGEALRDARHNWQDFEELKERLTNALREFKHNPFQKHFTSGKCYNPDGTLSSFLWQLQETWAERSTLAPLLDFEEHFQKIFLRRGLIIYCTLILEQMEKPKEEPNQLTLV